MLHVLSGPCGSGKSTRARELERQGYQVLAFDDLRQHSDLSPADITKRLILQASIALLLAFDVCIDACNLHPHDYVRWETVAIAFNVPFVWERLDTPMDLCIERDAERPTPVGAEFIRCQFAALESECT